MSKYSIGVRVVNEFAKTEAKAGNFNTVLPEHLWMGLIRLSELSKESISNILKGSDEKKSLLNTEAGKMREWFRCNRMESARTRLKLCQMLGKIRGTDVNQRSSSESAALFETAKDIANSEESKTMDAVHLARSVIKKPPPTLAKLVIQHGYSDPDIRHSDEKKILSRFGRDLTTEAAEGLLTPMIGRREEILSLARVLRQRRKGNALLLGDKGVGKTCIVEGLAQKIVSPKCSPAFRNKRIIELSIADLIRGAGHRDNLGKRWEAIIREAEADPNLILFLDEFHIIGREEGGAEIAAILSSALARGKLSLICAAGDQEYDRYLTKDETLSRQFEVIWIEELSREDTLEIIAAAKD